MSAALLKPYLLPALYFLACLLIAFVGRRRKWGFWGYLWASLLMSPVLGVLFLLAGDKPQWKPKSKSAAATPEAATTPRSPAESAPAVAPPAPSKTA